MLKVKQSRSHDRNKSLRFENLEDRRLLHADGAYYYEPLDSGVAVANYPDWMKEIPDGTKVSDVSIPGTHDSMAFYGGFDGTTFADTIPIAKTQSMPLAAQLRSGIRFLDIRAAYIDTNPNSNGNFRIPALGVPHCEASDIQHECVFGIYHGPVFQRTTLNAVFKEVLAFLDENPSETILMRLKDEHNEDNSAPRAEILNGHWDTDGNVRITEDDDATQKYQGFTVKDGKLRDGSKDANGVIYLDREYTVKDGLVLDNNGAPLTLYPNGPSGKLFDNKMTELLRALKNDAPDRFISNDCTSDLQLGPGTHSCNVRGKIVVTSQDWSSTAGFLRPYGDVIEDQNQFSVPSKGELYSKWESVKDFLTVTDNSAGQPKVYVNWLSATSFHAITEAGFNNPGAVLEAFEALPFFVASGHQETATDADRLSTGVKLPDSPTATERQHFDSIAPDFPRVDGKILFEGTNSLTANLIESGNYSHVGTVVADFPGERLISAVIGSNVFREAPTIRFSPNTYEVIEGGQVTLTAEVSDRNTSDRFISTFSTPPGCQKISEVRQTRQPRVVYKCDQPGEFFVEMTTTDGHFTVGPTRAILEVKNAPPILSIDTFGAVPEFGPGFVRLTGSYTDPSGNDEHTLRIHWGNVNGGFVDYEVSGGSFSQLQQYFPITEGLFFVRIGLFDGTNWVWEETSIDLAPSAEITNLFVGSGNSSQNEGERVSLWGTYDNVSSENPIVGINWGDGSSSDVVGNFGQFSAFHQYADDGEYTVSARVENSFRVGKTTSVTNADPKLTGLMQSVGDDFDYPGHTTAWVEGSYVDPGSGDTHTIDIDWGEGNIKEGIIVSGGSFRFLHLYSDSENERLFPVRVTIHDDDGGQHTDTFKILVRPIPLVKSITNLDGDEQSSIVRRIAVDFNTVVTIDENTFLLESLTDGGQVPVAIETEVSDAFPQATRAILTFGGPSTEFGSLVDGRYRLTVRGANVSSGNDGMGKSMTADVVDEFHRLFGDVGGADDGSSDAAVSFADFLSFREAFASRSEDDRYSRAWDFDDDGVIGLRDFLALRQRIGQTI